LSGAVIALPFLESLLPRQARAASPAAPFAIFVRQGNGVQQATADGEPERFWPSFAPGAFTSAVLAADTGRALSELASHAKDLTIVRGLRYNDPGNACRHSTAGNQALTAARPSADDCNSTLALGESIDNRIVTQLGAAVDEPLTLYVGRKTDYLDEVLSYRGARKLRAAERNPYTAYLNLFGLSNVAPDELARMRGRRKSVNDLVRAEMQTLLGRKDLSTADRARLDLHFTSVRDLENSLVCGLSEASSDDLEMGSSSLDDDDLFESVARLHLDLLALTMACGARRAATLQLGCGPDQTRYWIDGVKQVSFHQISHRLDADDPALLHHKIDRKLLGLFGYLLDKLKSYTTPQGTLLDQGVAVYLNDLGTGGHSYENIPYLLAGNAGGFLKTGLYVDLGGVTSNKILNTIGAAAGCTNTNGEPLDDFGDPSQEKGLVDAIVRAG
jgi:hypothetical protein